MPGRSARTCSARSSPPPGSCRRRSSRPAASPGGAAPRSRPRYSGRIAALRGWAPTSGCGAGSGRDRGRAVGMTPAWLRPRRSGNWSRRQAAAGRPAWDGLRCTPGVPHLVWAVARTHRLGPADAADVSQTVWLRLVENLGSLRDPDALPGWLRTTTRNECLRVIRRGGREVHRAEVGTDIRHLTLPRRTPAARRARRSSGGLARVVAPVSGPASSSRLLPRRRLRRNLPLAGPAGREHRSEPCAVPGQSASQAGADRPTAGRWVRPWTASWSIDWRALHDAVDPVPEPVVAAAHAAFEWRDVDAELAALTSDTLPAQAGMRSTGQARLLVFSGPRAVRRSRSSRSVDGTAWSGSCCRFGRARWSSNCSAAGAPSRPMPWAASGSRTCRPDRSGCDGRRPTARW